ncbi:cytochrome b/b6 domain-containing protein [Novosphingobium piscinae]|uniref:Cytochrome b/b6 domain-containing protein n=1 Tax=Novosphingobium piscinae TaxID=1507448 RepID=A0A7X1FYI7_9SPHN|nr:cytochrome b/b6 domain-containing protein [Novosphingobium piscinae]MBC2669350.1 cytochrome b/b6 domain-containing protein [Novosphingobium piscinae]
MSLAGVTATRLWDLPVRLVHWSFVVLLVALWLSAENGAIGLHKTLGLIMLGLVVFRLLWGFVGSSTARFAGFVRGPGRVLAYLRGLRDPGQAPVVGHNPLGGWSVLGLLGVLAVQVALGLVSQDTDGIESGPLNHLVSYDTAELARELHELLFNGLLLLVAIHLAAIVFYRVVKRDNLITPMITGRRQFAVPIEAPQIAPWWRAVLCAALAAALAWWVSLGAPKPGQKPPAQQMDASEYM